MMKNRKSMKAILICWVMLVAIAVTSCALPYRGIKKTEPKTVATTDVTKPTASVTATRTVPPTESSQTTTPRVTQPKPSEPAKDHSPNTVYETDEKHVVIDFAGYDGYVDNIIIIFLKPGITEEEMLSWFPGEGAKVVGSFPRMRQFQVRIKARTRSELNAFANQLMEKEQVLYAHVDLAASLLDNSKFHTKTHSIRRNTSAPRSMMSPNRQKPTNEWWYEAIRLKEAQKHLPTKNLVKMGVVDDGFDANHPDLKLAFASKDHEAENRPEDHGTHVAGIVQQILPNATITVADSYRIPGLDKAGHLPTLCQFLKYLVDLVEANVKVINYSMGADLSDQVMIPWAIEFGAASSVYIWLLKQTGHDFIVVQSAGNDGIDTYQNSMFCTINKDNCLGYAMVRKSLHVTDRLEEAQKTVFDSIVIAGSSGKKDAEGKYTYSDGTNFGDSITVLAPGDDIVSTAPGGGYMLMSGTSQAAPVVSAALGFLWSLDNNLTSGELKQLLIDSSTEEIVDHRSIGLTERRRNYPLLNLHEAVKRVLKISD